MMEKYKITEEDIVFSRRIGKLPFVIEVFDGIDDETEETTGFATALVDYNELIDEEKLLLNLEAEDDLKTLSELYNYSEINRVIADHPYAHIQITFKKNI